MGCRSQSHFETVRVAQKGSKDQGKEETGIEESEKRTNPVKEIILSATIFND